MQEEINLLDYFKIIRKNLKVFLPVFFICLLTGLTIVLSLPKIFYSETTIMLLGGGGQGGMAMLMAKLGGLGGLGQDANNANKLMILLNSRSLSERVAQRRDISQELDKYIATHVLKKPGDVSAFGIASRGGLLKSMLQKPTNAQGLVTISFESKSPVLAAMAARAYVEELKRYTSDNDLSESKIRLHNTSRQLVENRREFLETSKDISDYYEKNQISAVANVIDVPIAEDLEMGLDFPYTDLSGMAEERPGSVQTDLDALQAQKRELDSKMAQEAVRDVPHKVYLKYLEQKFQILMELNMVLSQEYTMVKINAGKEDMSFRLVDEARIPTAPSKPNTILLVPVVVAVALLLAVFAVFARHYYRRVRP